MRAGKGGLRENVRRGGDFSNTVPASPRKKFSPLLGRDWKNSRAIPYIKHGVRSHGRFPFFRFPSSKDFIAIKRLLTLLTCLSLSLALCGAEWFVFPETGKKKNPGTKAEPLKSIANAIKKAEAGDTLYLAAGLYTGARGASEIVVDKPLIIKGGYTTDFSSWDVIADIKKNIFGLNITAGV